MNNKSYEQKKKTKKAKFHKCGNKLKSTED